MSRLPVLFVSHGSPTFALEPGQAGPLLTQLGSRLRDVRAIVVISAHWITRGGVAVTTSPAPETIHDFGGFPAELYALQYPVAGAPQVAAETLALLQAAGIPAQADDRRGLDHGAWVPLLHLFPQAGIPTLQVSLPYPLDARIALRLGEALAPLREQGVLILASGSLTHNLYELRQPGSRAADYVGVFAKWVAQAVARGDRQALIDYRRLAPEAERAHPTEEHFLPLLVALGASQPGEPLEVLEGGVDYGVLAMDAYLLGRAPTLEQASA